MGIWGKFWGDFSNKQRQTPTGKNMKKTFMLICILLTAGLLLGQDNVKKDNTLEIGLSNAFYGMGEMVGTGLFVQYSYPLNDHFSLSAGMLSAYANRKETHNIGTLSNNFNHTSSFATNISLRITPFPQVKVLNRFSMNLGGLYHRLIHTWGALDVSSYSGGSYNTISTSYMDEYLWGLIGSANVSIFENDNITSGLSFDLYTSFANNMFNCDGYQIKLFLGVKL